MVAAKDSAVAVRSILTHAHVCDGNHVREVPLRLPESPLNYSVFRIGLASNFILVLRNTEHQDIVNSRILKLFKSIWKLINAISVLTRH